jgi:hypothetical protein
MQGDVILICSGYGIIEFLSWSLLQAEKTTKNVTQYSWYMNSGFNCVTSVNPSPGHYSHDYLLCCTLCQWFPWLLVPVANKCHLGLPSANGSRVTHFHVLDLNFINPNCIFSSHCFEAGLTIMAGRGNYS